jgi:hypothetical protein
MILDTHLDHGSHRHQLSGPVKLGVFEGRVYREPDRVHPPGGNAGVLLALSLRSFHEILNASGFTGLRWNRGSFATVPFPCPPRLVWLPQWAPAIARDSLPT